MPRLPVIASASVITSVGALPHGGAKRDVVQLPTLDLPATVGESAPRRERRWISSAFVIEPFHRIRCGDASSPGVGGMGTSDLSQVGSPLRAGEDSLYSASIPGHLHGHAMRSAPDASHSLGEKASRVGPGT